MKLRNLYFISITLLASALASCSDDTETFDNQIYMNASVKTSTVLLKNTVPSTEGQFQIAMAKPENQDVTISLKVDPTLVSTYNAAYYDNAEMLPDGYYTLENQQTTIPAGGILSEVVSVKFNKLTELDRDKVYVLPVAIDQANVGILQSARTMYYVLKGAALINVVADITKNLIYVDWKKPEVVENLNKMTVEALVHPNKFDNSISTVLGIEGYFLLRFGDTAPAKNCLQIVGPGDKKINAEDLAVTPGEWTHIAVTYDADAQKVVAYLNGVKKVDTSVEWGTPLNLGKTMTDEGNGFWIGHSYNRDRWLEGNISECRIWNKILTAEEINAKDHFYQVEPDAAGLVSYWKFDEGVGTSIADYSGNGNNATALNPLTWNAVELPAKN
ncbi:DUF1735 and LamG domain-containing protein [uncultured Bacteroides sp.]|uniref:DUF1735 and LamG domain-containing protein n=1 Tax=uncultured Bacteroides sp. TaxID=162156 RepID=UPI0025D9000F|nr:DUF1735 and LamG domain-containing protein [uncultured Bacteroides sp.]